MSLPVVSIITPLHNAEAYLAQAIKSVQVQTFVDWELLIIDDCSTDQSVAVVKQFTAKDSRIQLLQLEQNSGAAVARNKGLNAARGRYIAFLDADDLWFPYKLEKQLNFMEMTGCPFTFGEYEKINESGRVTGHIGMPEKITYSDMLKTCYPGCLTVMYDTQFFGKVEMPLIRKRQDYGLWLKLLKMSEYACGLQEVLGQYRVHSKSISANKINTASYTWHLFRQFEKLSLLKSLYYFSHYAIRGFLRSRMPKLARLLGVLH